MLIAGAGGFAKETLELLLQQGYSGNIYFFDDINGSVPKIHGKYEVLNLETQLIEMLEANPWFCIGVGGCREREVLFNKCILAGGRPYTLISPYARQGVNGISIGEGSIIATGTVLTSDISIGRGSLVNLNCTIGHDSKIGAFCELSPGVHLSGHCELGDYCAIGTGAVLIPGVKLGSHVTVGAGAVVTKDISSHTKVVGIPARPVVNS